MDTYMIILRIIHIFAGVFWVGGGMVQVMIVAPAAAAAGAAGGGFMRSMLLNTPWGNVIGLASFSTLVSGLLMYHKVSDGFNADWMNSSGGVVLSIGAVFGILAFGHGAGAMGRLTSQMVELIKPIQGAPNEEQRTQMMQLQQKLALHGRISLALMLISLLGMASARYF